VHVPLHDRRNRDDEVVVVVVVEVLMTIVASRLVVAVREAAMVGELIEDLMTIVASRLVDKKCCITATSRRGQTRRVARQGHI
jgi:hypothetical protein